MALEALKILMELEAAYKKRGEVEKFKKDLEDLRQALKQYGKEVASRRLLNLAEDMGVVSKQTAATTGALEDLGGALEQVSAKTQVAGRAHAAFAQTLQGKLIPALKTAAGIAGTLFFAGVAKAVKETTRWGQSVYELSLQTGMGAEEASKFAAMASYVGVSVKSLTRPLAVLKNSIASTQRNLASATEVVSAQGETLGFTSQKLARFGIALTDAQGRARPFVDVLADIGEVYRSLPSEADKAVLMQEAFGYKSAELAKILTLSRQEMAQVTEQYQRMGLVISTEGVQAVVEFQRSLNMLKDATSGLGVSIAADVLPPLTTLIQLAAGGVTKLSELWRSTQQATGGLAGVAATGMALAGASLGVSSALGSVSGLLGKLGISVAPKAAAALAGVASTLGTVGLYAGAAIAVIAGLEFAVRKLTGRALVPWEKIMGRITDKLKGWLGIKPPTAAEAEEEAMPGIGEAISSITKRTNEQIKALRKQLKAEQRAYRAEQRAWTRRLWAAKERVRMAQDEVERQKAAITAFQEAIDKEVKARLEAMGIILDPTRMENLKAAVQDARDQVKDAQDALELARSRRRRYGLTLISWEELNAEAALEMAKSEEARAEKALRLEERKKRVAERVRREVEAAHEGERAALEAALKLAQDKLELEREHYQALQREHERWAMARQEAFEQYQEAIQAQIEALQEQAQAATEQALAQAAAAKEQRSWLDVYREEWAKGRQVWKENLGEQYSWLEKFLEEHKWIGGAWEGLCGAAGKAREKIGEIVEKLRTETFPSVATWAEGVKEETLEIWHNLRDVTWPSIKKSFATQAASIKETWRHLKEETFPSVVTWAKARKEEAEGIYHHLRDETWPSVWSSIKTQWSSIVETWGFLRDSAREAKEEIAEKVDKLRFETFPAIETWAGEIKDEVITIWHGLRDETWPSIWGSITTQWDSIKETWGFMKDKIGEIGDLWGKIKGKFSGLVDKLKELLGKLKLPSLGGLGGGGGGGGAGGFGPPGFQRGGLVPQTGTYVLHKGEFVIPSRQLAILKGLGKLANELRIPEVGVSPTFDFHVHVTGMEQPFQMRINEYATGLRWAQVFS